MSEGFGISAEEQERLRRQLRIFSAKKTQKLKMATQVAVTNIVADAKRAVPTYQGRLRSSLKPIMSVNGLSGRAWTDVEYAAAVEFGTKLLAQIPAEIAQNAAQFKNLGDGDFDELVEQIRKWCKKKGIPEEAAYPISLKLVRKGQKPQPYLYQAFRAEQRKYIDAIKKIMNQPER